MYHWFILIKHSADPVALKRSRAPFQGPLGPLLKEPSRHTLAVPASTTPWCQAWPIGRWTWGLSVTIFLTSFHFFCNDVLRDFGRFREISGDFGRFREISGDFGRFRGSKLLFFCGDWKKSLPLATFPFLGKSRAHGEPSWSMLVHSWWGTKAQTSHRCNHTWSPGMWHGMANTNHTHK